MKLKKYSLAISTECTNNDLYFFNNKLSIMNITKYRFKKTTVINDQ